MIADAGFPGTVVLVRSRGVDVVARARRRGRRSRVAAGEPWDDVVATTVDAGWSGVECLSGIPGSAGATPIQNVGAYGQEVAETISRRRGLRPGRRRGAPLCSPDECGFAYRTSMFKHSDRWVVLSVDFRLRRVPLSAPVRYAELARALGVAVGDRVPLADARAAVLELRAGKGMVLDPADPDTYSVGSFFTNPVLDADGVRAMRERADGSEPPAWPGTDGLVKVSAAWLIEQAGFGKGYARGTVRDLEQAHARADQPRRRHDRGAAGAGPEIRDGVHARFGVTLHPEPVLVGCEF